MEHLSLASFERFIFVVIAAIPLPVLAPPLLGQQDRPAAGSFEAAWSTIQQLVQSLENAVQSKNLHGIHEPSMKIRAPIRSLKQHCPACSSAPEADDTLELVSQVKTAFYSVQASEQLLKQFKLILDTNAASLDLSQRQYEAGNISELALARQQAAYSASRLDVATTEAEIRQNREKLTRLLGLWGRETDWHIAGELPEVPASDLPMSGLERLAMSQRLDLQAEYLSVASQAKNLGLTKSFRLLGALDFGLEIERETDTQIRTGPTFAIELPVFNQGQARIARGEAALRQAQDKFEALAIDVRSEIRELRDELASKRQIARFYKDELLPDQRRILSESLMYYNAMEVSDFELLTTKADEARTEREYIEAVRDYWITRAELERAVGGSLRLREPAQDKSQPVANSSTK
jgi:outer membrane protein, heavy metal efflux system